MQKTVKATIFLLNAAGGGRIAPVAGNGCQYRPHVRVGEKRQYLGVSFLDGPELMVPGTEAFVKMALVYHPDVDYSALVVGETFEILEGPHVVGTGVIMEI